VGDIVPPDCVLSWGLEEEAMDRILIVYAMIVDGSGAAPFSGDVLVEGERDLLVGELARLHRRLLRPHRWGGGRGTAGYLTT
jgi:hypothetical protein